MKNILTVLFVLFAFNAFSNTNEMGVGVMLGNPTGLNGKYWLGEDQAIDGGLAYSLGKNSELSIHSDYLWHKEGAFIFNDTHPLDLYYGLGGRMEFGNDIELGLRLPVGLVHKFKETEQSADMFAEVAPIIDFVGRTGLEMHIAIGARYYFR